MNNFSGYNIHISNELPEWIQKFGEESLNGGSIASAQGVEYLIVEDQYYLEDYQVTRFKKLAKHAVNMNGVEECSKLLIDFNQNDNLIIHKILIKRNDQIIDKLNSAEMQILRREYQAERNILTGDITLSIILNDIKINDLVIVSFSLIFTNEFYVNYFSRLLQLDYGVPIYKFYLTVLFDKKKSIEYKFLNQQENIEWRESQNNNVLIIDKTSVPAKSFLKYEPYWYWKTSYLQIGIKKTWHEVALGYARYFQCSEIKEPILLNLINEIKSDRQNDEQAILSIFHYINNNIRYFSNYNPVDFIKPTDPDTTIQRAYGDCKDLVFLFHTILTHLNINSYPVLVNSVYGKSLNEVCPSGFLFDHAIILVTIDNQDYFMDLTIRQDIDSLKHIYTPYFGYGLVCDEKTECLMAINNQAGCRDTISVSEEYNIVSWEMNNIIFKSTIKLTGLSALKLRKNCADDQEKLQLWNLFKNFYQKFMEIHEIISNEIHSDPLKNNQIIYTVCYRISLKGFRNQGKKYEFEILPMDMLEYVFQTLPANLEENTDFYYGIPFSMDYQIAFTGEEIELLNAEKWIVEDDVFMFSKEAQVNLGSCSLKYQFKRLKEVIPHKDYLGFLANNSRMKELTPTIIYKKNITRPRGAWSRIQSMFYVFIIMACITSFITRNSNSIIQSLIPSRTLPDNTSPPSDLPPCKPWWETYNGDLHSHSPCQKVN